MKKQKIQKYIIYLVSLCMALFIVFTGSIPALADTALSVQVTKSGKTVTVKEYSFEELNKLPSVQLSYSSLDAMSSPVKILAEGITVNNLLQALDIPVSDVVSMRLSSSDGWQHSFSSEEYLNSSRYYYNGIVDGYDTESGDPPEFIADTDQNKQQVPIVLALKSYEGRFENEPQSGSLTENNGIRFCFGQVAITDKVMLDYGKHINKIVFELNDSTDYVLSDGDSVVTDDSSPVSENGVVEEIDTQGLAADTLTITVGYYGGNYYTKKVFTLKELQAMDQVKQVYSYIDNMPAVCLDSAVGVRLTDIMDAAGIDVNSIQSYHFYCTDIARTWYLTLPKDYLLDTMRFYYPNLPAHWDYDEAVATIGATDGAIPVDTIIAWQDNWRRFATEPNFDQMTGTTCFRLLFGQTDVKTPTSSRSAKWIHTIAVTLGGTPPAGITLDESALDLEVGSEFQVNATLKIDNNTTDQRITWSSSDPDIVSVDKKGKIKVLSEGTAVITATTVMGGLTASVAVNGDQEDQNSTIASANSSELNGNSGVKADILSDNNTEIDNSEGTSVYQIDIESGAESSPVNQGAIQNWRIYEMSESAIAFSDIVQEPNPLIIPTVIIAVFLLFSGVAMKTIYYFKQL